LAWRTLPRARRACSTLQPVCLIFAVMVGLAWILSGVAQLMFAFNVTGALRTMLIVFGVVSTVFGGLL
jgi:uncharacterized membrane protein HdeD (DUF308 family)